MSKARRVDRRTLFDVFRRNADSASASTTEDAPSDSAFSLERFYAARDQDADCADALPHFAVRRALPLVDTVPAYAEPIGPGEKRPK